MATYSRSGGAGYGIDLNQACALGVHDHHRSVRGIQFSH